MNHSPSYIVIVPFAALYTLLLFIPTIDALALMEISLFGYKLNFSMAALLFPAIFPMSDSLTEVYNKKIAYHVVFSCYVILIIFSLIHYLLLSNTENKGLYEFILTPSLIITTSGTFSYIITSCLNINLINKLKIKMRSRHFIFRSLVCSSISGFIMSLIVQFSLNYKNGLYYFINIFISTCIIKLMVTIPYVYMAKFFVIIYRYVDGIEPEIFNKNLTASNLNGAVK
ncbi:MAG: VUT family protein [Legionella sp.]|nr:VUT family protein [Legionella sp.]